MGYQALKSHLGLGSSIRASPRENLSSGLPIRSDTNRAVRPQNMDGGLKFWIYEVEECPIYQGKITDVRLCFRKCKTWVFSAQFI